MQYWSFDDFILPFEGKLKADSRSVKMSVIFFAKKHFGKNGCS
jgi:hypothetical protein